MILNSTDWGNNSSAHLPDREGLWVHNSWLDDLLGREHAPSDCIDISRAHIGDEVTLGIDGHVGDGRLFLQPGLQRLQACW